MGLLKPAMDIMRELAAKEAELECIAADPKGALDKETQQQLREVKQKLDKASNQLQSFLAGS